LIIYFKRDIDNRNAFVLKIEKMSGKLILFETYNKFSDGLKL